MRVVDTHFHWFPRPHLERLSQQEGYPRAERDGEGFVYIYNEGRERMPLAPVWLDLEAGLAVSERATGRDTTVVSTAGVLSGLLDQLPSADAIEVAVEYNEEMAAAQKELSGRFIGTAVVPLGDTDEALSVLDHAIKELDLRGVNLPPLSGSRMIDSDSLDNFYSRVEELEVPLIVHPTDIVFSDVLQDYGGALQLTIGRLIDSSMTVLRLIFSGIMERHPDLRVVQTHAGALLPYQAGRFDKNTRIKGLPKAPSEYMKRLVVDTVAPQALTVRTAVEFFGDTNVVYGTDYPCWSPAAAIAVIEESNLSDEARNAVLSKNASAIFHLG